MSKDNLLNYAKQQAAKLGIPVNIALALIKQESGGSHYDKGGKVLTSPAGALGLMQLMPGTAKGLGVNPLNPYENIDGGLRYLAQQFKTFGSWDKALAAYNAGPGAVSKYKGIPPYKETQNYVNNILGSLGGGIGGPTIESLPELEDIIKSVTTEPTNQAQGEQEMATQPSSQTNPISIDQILSILAKTQTPPIDPSILSSLTTQQQTQQPTPIEPISKKQSLGKAAAGAFLAAMMGGNPLDMLFGAGMAGFGDYSAQKKSAADIAKENRALAAKNSGQLSEAKGDMLKHMLDIQKTNAATRASDLTAATKFADLLQKPNTAEQNRRRTEAYEKKAQAAAQASEASAKLNTLKAKWVNINEALKTKKGIADLIKQNTVIEYTTALKRNLDQVYNLKKGALTEKQKAAYKEASSQLKTLNKEIADLQKEMRGGGSTGMFMGTPSSAGINTGLEKTIKEKLAKVADLELEMREIVGSEAGSGKLDAF